MGKKKTNLKGSAFNIFKSIRINADKTQEEIAEMLDVSVQSVSRYENNRQSPGSDILKKYAAIGNIPVETLMNELESPPIVKQIVNDQIVSTITFLNTLPGVMIEQNEEMYKISFEKSFNDFVGRFSVNLDRAAFLSVEMNIRNIVTNIVASIAAAGSRDII